MKKRFLALISLLCLCSCSEDFVYNPQPLDPSVHYDNVYVIMGQSNATGISQASFLATKSPEVYEKYSAGNPNVLIAADVDGHVYKDFQPVRFGFGADEGYFGPEIGISDILSEANETTYVIKATWSGSSLQADYMDKNGNTYRLYDRYVPFIKNQIKKLKDNGKNPRIKGLFWMQGESDSLDGLCETYGQAFDLFMNGLKQEFYDYIYGYLNFVDANISTRSPHWPNPNIINYQKQIYSESNEHSYCIKTNGEDEFALNLILKSETEDEGDDKAHYCALSMLDLGREAAKYLIK